jgi:hypothetical protein
MENIDLPTPALIKVKLLYQMSFLYGHFLNKTFLQLETNFLKIHVKSACF